MIFQIRREFGAKNSKKKKLKNLNVDASRGSGASGPAFGHTPALTTAFVHTP